MLTRFYILFVTYFIAQVAFANPLTIVAINDNSSLSWKLSTPATGQLSNVTTSFGSAGDHIVFGSFTAINTTNLGIITIKEGSNQATWKIINSTGQILKNIKFGNEDSLFVAGADFDNNGIIDPAYINTSSSAAKWNIKINGLTSQATDLVIKHGKSKHTTSSFFINFFGDGDWIGFITKRKNGTLRLILKNVFSKERRNINIGTLSGSYKRPLPIANSAKIDLVALTEIVDGKTKATFINNLGQIVNTRTFASTETVVVGDFNPDAPGEEYAVQSNNKLATYNPFSNIARTFNIPDAILVDKININTFTNNEPDNGGGTCPGGTAGICGCRFLDETDGYKTGFVYKRKSDTYGGIVMVLPNPCGRQTTALVTLDTDCNEIHHLTDTGYHNPDHTGERRHFKEVDARYDGYWYRNNYGSIILKMEGAGTCFMIENPAEERID